MRALAAILILSACSRLYAQPRGLKTIQNIADCIVTLGATKCVGALTAWRAQRALKHPNSTISLENDLEQFSWSKYRNNTQEDIYSEVCDDTEKLLRRQALSLTLIPGYRLQLHSKGNGTLNVDIYKSVDTRSGRGMKKAKKTLGQLLPLLALPGLMMAAILPFMLPALKMMTLGAVMLNNMALTGAVFTLLRNNAFNDKYEHKYVYVNEGYKNEKHAHAHEHNDEYDIKDHFDYQYAESKPGGYEIADMEPIEELPLNADWIKQYYGNGKDVRLAQNAHQIKRGDKLKENT